MQAWRDTPNDGRHLARIVYPRVVTPFQAVCLGDKSISNIFPYDRKPKSHLLRTTKTTTVVGLARSFFVSNLSKLIAKRADFRAPAGVRTSSQATLGGCRWVCALRNACERSTDCWRGFISPDWAHPPSVGWYGYVYSNGVYAFGGLLLLFCCLRARACRRAVGTVGNDSDI